jgi:aspartate aminotransferase-like enzyme
VLPDAWHVDLCLGGAQKCLAALPDTCFLSVSEAAWEAIDAVDYAGYDALKPFKTAVERHYFPYTPGWQATAGLNAGAEAILKEGLESCFRRHAEVADFCRRRLAEIGYALYPAPGAVNSPTVTAVKVPAGVEWAEFDRRLRAAGLVVGGSYGPMAGTVFRLGHMGTQANMGLMQQALGVLETEIRRLRG